jgi:hypothetical protein
MLEQFAAAATAYTLFLEVPDRDMGRAFLVFVFGLSR